MIHRASNSDDDTQCLKEKGEKFHAMQINIPTDEVQIVTQVQVVLLSSLALQAQYNYFVPLSISSC